MKLLRMVLLTLILVGCGSAAQPSQQRPATSQQAADVDVTYTAKCGERFCSGTITYATATGIEQTTQRLPFTKTIRVPAGTPLSLSAQINITASVTCGINGSENTSSGAYAVASCRGVAK